MSDSGWSDDEWVDSGHVDGSGPAPHDAPTNMVASGATESAVSPSWVPIFSSGDRENMSVDLELLNSVQSKNTACIYRCEPANKHYPGIRIPERLKTARTLMLTIELHNAVGAPKRTRMPDFKTKGLKFERCVGPGQRPPPGEQPSKDVVFLKQPFPDVVHFKKKCQDKITHKDIAFELGGGFVSHTGEITPQFTIVATPFIGNKLCVEQAARTEKFHVFSKRQDRFMVRTKKRRKKNTEILRKETNIKEAEVVLKSLEQKLQTEKLRNDIISSSLREIRLRSAKLPSGPMKIAIEYATRQLESDDVVTM